MRSHTALCNSGLFAGLHNFSIKSNALKLDTAQRVYSVNNDFLSRCGFVHGWTDREMQSIYHPLVNYVEIFYYVRHWLATKTYTMAH